LRDQCGIEGRNKKTFDSGKTGMKAFNESAQKQFERAGLILLFVGEVTKQSKVPRPMSKVLMTLGFKLWTFDSRSDEHNQIGILTSGFEPLSRLPNSASGTSGIGSLYPVTVAQPSRIFTGFPDLAVLDGEPSFEFQRARKLLIAQSVLPTKIFKANQFSPIP
jgi:hypothetical protein